MMIFKQHAFSRNTHKIYTVNSLIGQRKRELPLMERANVAAVAGGHVVGTACIIRARRAIMYFTNQGADDEL
jgi:hypothetical protein